MTQTVTFRKCRNACLDRLVNPPFRNLPLRRQLAYLLCSPCVFLLAVRTHASEATQPPFGADTWLCHRCCGLVSCTLQEPTLQEPRRDPRGAGHVRRRMPRPDATPRCVGRQELCNRVGELPSSPRLSRRQGGHGRRASRRHLAVLEIQRCAIPSRRLAFACADCMITASPCRAEPSALVRKQYPESDTPSCAAMLRDCRAHGTARRRQTSWGAPPHPAYHPYLHFHVRRWRWTYLDTSVFVWHEDI